MEVHLWSGHMVRSVEGANLKEMSKFKEEIMKRSSSLDLEIGACVVLPALHQVELGNIA